MDGATEDYNYDDANMTLETLHERFEALELRRAELERSKAAAAAVAQETRSTAPVNNAEPDNDDEGEQIRQEFKKLTRQAERFTAKMNQDRAERLEAVEREIAEHRAARQVYRALMDGTFYSSLLQVWTPSYSSYSEGEYEGDQPSELQEDGDVVVVRLRDCTQAHFDALHRLKCPSIYSYRETVAAAMNATNIAKNLDTLSTRSSLSSGQSMLGPTSVRAALWPKDLLGRGSPIGRAACLIPASSKQSSMYDDVATWALGLAVPAQLQNFYNEENVDVNNDERIATMEREFWNVKQRAIHGSRPEDGTSRVAHTGLKHSPYNKIRLWGHAYFMNIYPCVMIVPIMSLDDMRNWNGDGYEAIVVAGAWRTSYSFIEASEAYRCIGMNQGPVADLDELEQSRQLLGHVIRGLAFSLWKRRRYLLEPESAELLDQYRLRFTNESDPVIVPLNKNQQQQQHEPLRVRKITFGIGVHLPPDPLLLTVKAAVVWSKQHGQQLLACGEGETEDEHNRYDIPSDDGLSIQAEEEVLEQLELFNMNRHQSTSWEDLAVGLGQPNGYCGSDAAVGVDSCA